MPTNHDPPAPTTSTIPTYRVFTDGSASVKRTRTGAWCAVILAPDGTRHVTCGCAAPTTIGRMETQAVIASLQFIIDREDGCKDGYAIHIRCDSEFVCGVVQGRYERHKNKHLWAAFDQLADNLILQIGWTARNTIPEQAECDATCDALRRGLEQFLEPDPAKP